MTCPVAVVKLEMETSGSWGNVQQSLGNGDGWGSHARCSVDALGCDPSCDASQPDFPFLPVI